MYPAVGLQGCGMDGKDDKSDASEEYREPDAMELAAQALELMRLFTQLSDRDRKAVISFAKQLHLQ
jgi:hypothetical protein